MTELDKLKAENAELKKKLQGITQYGSVNGAKIAELKKENSRLRDEIDYVKADAQEQINDLHIRLGKVGEVLRYYEETSGDGKNAREALPLIEPKSSKYGPLPRVSFCRQVTTHTIQPHECGLLGLGYKNQFFVVY